MLARRPRQLAAGHPHGLGQRHPADELEDALVRAAVLRELVAVAARQVLLFFSGRSTRAPAKLSSTAGSCRKSPMSRNRRDPAPHIDPKACVHLGDLLNHQPMELAVAVAHRAAHPVVGGLRSQPQVLRFRDQLHHVAGLRSCSTMRLARCVFPVPGSPVSSRLRPCRQWATGS